MTGRQTQPTLKTNATVSAIRHRYHYGYPYQLANAIYPLIEDALPLEEILNNYSGKYQTAYYQMMCQKPGLNTSFSNRKENLINRLENLLTSAETDMTIFYQVLANTPLDKNIKKQINTLENAFYIPEQTNETYIQTLKSWITQYQIICDEEKLDPSERAQRMNSANPTYTLRN